MLQGFLLFQIQRLNSHMVDFSYDWWIHKKWPEKGEPRYWATGMIKNNTFPEVPDELMGQTFPCLGMHTFLGGLQGARLMETACDNCKQKLFCILAFRFIGCFTLERWTSNINLIKLPGSSLVWVSTCSRLFRCISHLRIYTWPPSFCKIILASHHLCAIVSQQKSHLSPTQTPTLQPNRDILGGQVDRHALGLRRGIATT